MNLNNIENIDYYISPTHEKYIDVKFSKGEYANKPELMRNILSVYYEQITHDCAQYDLTETTHTNSKNKIIVKLTKTYFDLINNLLKNENFKENNMDEFITRAIMNSIIIDYVNKPMKDIIDELRTNLIKTRIKTNKNINLTEKQFITNKLQQYYNDAVDNI